MVDVRARLSAEDLPSRLDKLGFRPDDAADLNAALAKVIDDGELVARVEAMAGRLIAGIGTFDSQPADPWEGDVDTGLGVGLLPMLALLASVDEVREFHRQRGVPSDISWRSLSDLGQQVWVHRLTYRSFGLHTHTWLCLVWSGAFYWLGRLQFNLHLEQGDWVLSTHIPQSGPLTPDSVDAALDRAASFFARHFSDYPYRHFYCSSWLLDPQLGEVLDPESNIVRFMSRWQRYGEPRVADEDVLFFVFRRRGVLDPARLPIRTTLEEAVVDRLTNGGHWYSWRGFLDRDQQSAIDHEESRD